MFLLKLLYITIVYKSIWDQFNFDRVWFNFESLHLFTLYGVNTIEPRERVLSSLILIF